MNPFRLVVAARGTQLMIKLQLHFPYVNVSTDGTNACFIHGTKVCLETYSALWTPL